jgi:hypothetical protein
MDRSQRFINEATDIVAASLPRIEFSRIGMGRCHIPETECPPHCVCRIVWDVSRGEKLRATIDVTNRSPTTRVFNFTATPFRGPNNPATPIQLTPASASLNPNQTVVVTVEFVVTDEFQHCQTYTAEVLIRGAYEQCVHVTCNIEPDKTAHCVVEQGDPPTRIRAHHWHSHFQCEEPCPETKTRPTPVGAAPETPPPQPIP